MAIDICVTLERRVDGKILQARSLSVGGDDPRVREMLWDAVSSLMDLGAMAGLGTPSNNLRSGPTVKAGHSDV